MLFLILSLSSGPLAGEALGLKFEVSGQGLEG